MFVKKLLFFIIALLSFETVNATTITKYYRTTYYDNYSISEEIDEDSVKNIKNMCDRNEIQFITNYKKLKLSNDNNLIELELTWLNAPVYKSFDVIAIRTTGVSIDTSNIFGRQSTNLQTFFYNGLSNNTKYQNNNVGISMNLQDSASSWTLYLSVPYTGTGTVYGTYQHAKANVSLLQSKSYSFDSSGLGGVLLFDSNVGKYYDGMQGISLSF